MALLAALLLAACSSSAKSSSGSSSSAKSSSGSLSSGTSAARGTPIVIGNLGSYSGVEGSSIGAAKPAIKAWAASVNASGGIDGHPIDLIIKEDGDSPSAGLADAKALLQDHVVAMVGDWSDTDTAWAPLFEQAGVPIIGGGPSAPDLKSDPLFFPAQTSVAYAEYGALDAAKLGGATKIAVPYCAEVAQCALGVTLGKQVAPELGMQLVYAGAFSSSSPDLTPQCLAARNSGATGVEPSATADEDLHFAEACYEQGWKPIYEVSDTSVSDQWLGVPAFNKLYSEQGDAPWFDTSTPALKAFHADISKYAPGTAFDPATIESWATGELFQAAVAASGSSTVTTASILAGLYNLHNDTLGGVAPPLSFTRGQDAAVKCFFIVGIHDGNWTEPQGLKTGCAP